MSHDSNSRLKRLTQPSLPGFVPAIHGRNGFLTSLERLGVAAEWALGTSPRVRSEEHTSELQSLMRISYAVFCLKKKTKKTILTNTQAPIHMTAPSANRTSPT